MRTLLDDLFDDPYSYDEDDDFETVEYKFIPANSQVINVRTIADGASTLTELADLLRIYADHIDTLADAGYQLYEDIADGQGYAFKEEEEEGRVDSWAI
jgi:hypothetical protein